MTHHTPARRLLAVLEPQETPTSFICKISDGHYARIKVLLNEAGRSAARAYIQAHIFDPLGTKTTRLEEITISRCGVDPWRGDSPLFKLVATTKPLDPLK